MKKITFLIFALLVQIYWAQAQVNLANGLVAQYTFNNGNANDETGANHGTVVGATLTTDRFGNADKAYSFSNAYIKVPHTTAIDLNLMSGLSISVWVKEGTTTSGLLSIVTKWNGSTSEQYGIFDNGNNNTVAVRTVNSNGITDAANRSLNTWHHVVFTYDKATGAHKIYTDKVLTLNQTKAGNYANSTATTSLGIGAQINDLNGAGASPSRFFNGSIDDVLIYNRVLNQAEVDSLFNTSTTIQTQPVNGLVAKYSFNNGTPNDEAGSNHGTAVGNATLTADRFGNPNMAYTFSNAYVKVPHSNTLDLDQMAGLSISAWVKETGASSGLRAIVAKWKGSTSEQYALFDNGNNNTVAIRSINSNGITDAANRSLNTWHHVVFTYDKATGQHKIYTDKVITLNQIMPGTYTNATVTTSLGIGAQLNDENGGGITSSRFFLGSIDDVHIYNRVLSQTEVDSLFNLPNPVVTPPVQMAPTARYSFNQGNANDEIGTNHGTPNGVTLATDRFGNANKAYSFVNGDYIALPNAPELKNEAMTVSLWVAPDSFAASNVNANYLYTVTNTLSGAWLCNFCLTLEPSSSKYLSVVQNGAAAPSNSVVLRSAATLPAMPQWSHYVLTMTHDSVKSYINGVLDGQGAKGFTSNFTSDSIYIGTARNSNYFGNFNGRLDDIVVYTRALSATEVDSIYQAEKVLSINEHLPEIQAIGVYPNPSAGLLHVSGVYHLCLTDLQGRRLIAQAETDQLDLSPLATGMYYLQIRNREGQLLQTTRVAKL